MLALARKNEKHRHHSLELAVICCPITYTSFFTGTKLYCCVISVLDTAFTSSECGLLLSQSYDGDMRVHITYPRLFKPAILQLLTLSYSATIPTKRVSDWVSEWVEFHVHVPSQHMKRQACREGGIGGKLPKAPWRLGAPLSIRNIKYTRMHHYEGPHENVWGLCENVSPGPAWLSTGLWRGGHIVASLPETN